MYEYEHDSTGITCTARCDENSTELILKFDEHGNCIYSKGEDGYEHWLEYDKEGIQIYGKDPKDWENKEFEEWRCEFDEKGNLIYSKDRNGKESFIKIEYDANGNIILHGNTKYENTYWPDGKTLKMTREI